MLDFLHSAWTVVYTLVLALFLFGLTVFVHEFGHFIVARKCGLKILTFSIGFGKAIWQWERDGIVYKIGWIPFGGYVALPQLDPAGMEKIQGKDDDGAEEGAQKGERSPPISPWKKIAVSVAGPLGNILFAILLALIIWLAPGNEAGTQIRSVIGSVETNSVPFEAGLRPGDEILAVNTKPVRTWYAYQSETLLQGGDTVSLTVRSAGMEKQVVLPVVSRHGGERLVEGLSPALPCVVDFVFPGSPADAGGLQSGDVVISVDRTPIQGSSHFSKMIAGVQAGREVAIKVERDDSLINLSVVPEYNDEKQRVMVGVQVGSMISMPWMEYKNPIDQIKYDASAIVRMLQALTTPAEASHAAKGLSGPVGIFDILMVSIQMGLWTTLGLIRLININLALLNLLPIPVLDGGHIVFSLWEGITRRKVHAKMQAVLINLCAILLIFAMLLITFNDIDRKLHIKDFFGRLIPDQSEEVLPSGDE